MSANKNRYIQIIEEVFLKHYQAGSEEVSFTRDDIVNSAKQFKITLPKNIGDLIYSFRYRTELPTLITKEAPKGFEWIIRPAGRGKYQFVLAKQTNFAPNLGLVKIKIPDATPGLIDIYSLDDEQSLLAKIRYNRLIDIFTGATCYSLQNHLRTSLSGAGQIETDEIYLGIDKNGTHYVFPVQAKSIKDKIGIIQIEQDFLLCQKKFSKAIGRPIAAQYVDDQTIALFEFTRSVEGIKILSEKQFMLVRPENLSQEEIEQYRNYIS